MSDPRRFSHSLNHDPLTGFNDDVIPQRAKKKPEKVVPIDIAHEMERQAMLRDIYADTGVFDEPTVPFGKGSRGA